MRWWIVWLSLADKRFHCVSATTQFGAEMTARTLVKQNPPTVINGVNLNYACNAWALQAPSKRKALQVVEEEWARTHLNKGVNALIN